MTYALRASGNLDMKFSVSQIRRIARALGMLTNEPLANYLIVQSEAVYKPRDPTESCPKGFAIVCDESGICLSYYKALAMTGDELGLFDWRGRRASAFQPVHEMQRFSNLAKKQACFFKLPVKIWGS